MQQTALVTGGAKRLGRAMVLALAREGFDIALHYHHSEAEAHEVAELVRSEGRVCELFCCDLGDLHQVRQLMPAVFEHFKGCSLLINNASIFEPGSLLETTEEQLTQHLTINLQTPFILSQQFAGLVESSGLIVNILDAQVVNYQTRHFAYLLSKKALAELNLMLALELAPRIRVNAIAPGPVLAPPGKDQDYLKEKVAQTPLQVSGTAEDIAAEVINFWHKSYLTGQIVYVDGGQHLGSKEGK